MKIVLNKDFLSIENLDDMLISAGSINFYKIEVVSDESWKELIKVAVLIKDKEKEGVKIPVIGNHIYIDQLSSGKYKIGFIGYKSEQDKKTYQISTNLKAIYFNAGAGEIKATEVQPLEMTEWEKYIKQIEELTNNITDIPNGGRKGQVLGKKSDADKDIGWINQTGGSGEGGGTYDYSQLDNKPQINGIPLEGNKTNEDLGIKQNYTANDIKFTDGETFQDKYDKGELKGQNGLDGLPGEPGIQGPAGPEGKPGTTTYTELTDKPSINGVPLEGNKTSDELNIKAVTEVYKAQTEAPEDTNVLWIDTDDNSGEGSGSQTTVDAEMSDTSENAVQNKVIKQYIDKMDNKSLGVSNAQVGQIIEVEAIDEAGKPTKWKAVNKPTGGQGGQWKKIFSMKYDKNLEVHIESVDYDSNTITKRNHGLINGDIVYATGEFNYNDSISRGAVPQHYMPNNILMNKKMYVINATTDTFQLSLEKTGTPIDIVIHGDIDFAKWHLEKDKDASGTTIKISNLNIENDIKIVSIGRVLFNTSLASETDSSNISKPTVTPKTFLNDICSVTNEPAYGVSQNSRCLAIGNSNVQSCAEGTIIKNDGYYTLKSCCTYSFSENGGKWSVKSGEANFFSIKDTKEILPKNISLTYWNLSPANGYRIEVYTK